MVSLTSAELNYLIFRYLNESGLQHSAFALGYECGLNKSNIDGNLVPPGALVTFIQKGIQYLELETNLTDDDLDSDDDFQYLTPLDLITKDVAELQRIIKEKKGSAHKDKSKGTEKEPIEKGQEPENGHAADMDIELTKEKEKEKHQREKGKEKARSNHVGEDARDAISGRLEESGTEGGSEPMNICTSSASVACEIPTSDVTVLHGHTSEVFACAWNPNNSLLASSSGDSTARIWTIGGQSGPPPSVVLKHFKVAPDDKCKDVTTLEWNPDGTLLATGFSDGQARIWSRDGKLISVLSKHKGPIFSLKWNKKGDYIASGSVDATAVVWDVKNAELKQQFEFHTAPVLDVDWRNNVTFATCSIDHMVHVCRVGENRPMKSFAGHQAEVNAIKWDPTGSLLASCSDDRTAKIWNTKQDMCLLDFREHTKEIYTVRWSPTGPGTNNPNQKLLLASASFDSTIKLWDVESGRLLQSLNGHREPVYSVSYSPNGKYLASGSLDKCLHIWSLKEGKIVRSFTGNGGIFEVCWNKEGDKIAASFSTDIVCVLDFKI